MLEKAAVLKQFEYSQLGKVLKAQTSFAEKYYQGKNKFIKTDEKEEPITIRKEKPEVFSESKLIYESKVGFSDYKDIINCFRFYHRSNEFRNLMPRTEKTKIKKKNMYIINYIINKTI